MNSLEITESYYQYFNQKNWQGMLALVHPDILHEANQGKVRAGVEKFAEFLKHTNDCYDEALTEMVFLTEPTGKRVAVEFVVSGTYKKTDGDFITAKNQTYTLPAVAFLAFKDGKIARVTTYYNLQLWLKLVGG
jgi:steroid delta-isomerase-like uncharacterized protein